MCAGLRVQEAGFLTNLWWLPCPQEATPPAMLGWEEELPTRCQSGVNAQKDDATTRYAATKRNQTQDAQGSNNVPSSPPPPLLYPIRFFSRVQDSLSAQKRSTLYKGRFPIIKQLVNCSAESWNKGKFLALLISPSSIKRIHAKGTAYLSSSIILHNTRIKYLTSIYNYIFFSTPSNFQVVQHILCSSFYSISQSFLVY